MDSPQEHANKMLLHWQDQRHLPPQDRRLSGDIGNMTFGVRANALDLFELWMSRSDRRIEFGQPEREDIREALKTLGNLLLELDGTHADEPQLKSVTRR